MATLLATTIAGCSEETSIRIYRVAKVESRGAQMTVTSTLAQSAKEQLMLGAIVPNKDFAWFFKIAGEPELVAKNGDSFRNMVESVNFDESSQPSWKLSEGWQQTITPAEITYGKLTHGESGLTATVTRLPFTSEASLESWQGYVVSNINRWRKQLSLQEQKWSEMSTEIEELPNLSQGSSKAYFVSLSGKGSGSGGMAPFMNMGGGVAPPDAQDGPAPGVEASPNTDQTTSANDPTATEKPAEKPISYQVPEGWSETPASGMRMAAFEVADGETKGEVTVIAAGGSIDDNLSIWLGQVGAESTEENKQSILQSAEELAVNKITAKLYSIDGPAPKRADGSVEAPATTNSILIAEIPWRENMSLFAKYKGPTTLAVAQREKLVNFVKSIEWN